MDIVVGEVARMCTRLCTTTTYNINYVLCLQKHSAFLTGRLIITNHMEITEKIQS